MTIWTGRARKAIVLGIMALTLGSIAGAGTVSGISDLPYSGKFYLYHSTSTGPTALGPLASLSGCSTYVPVVEQSVAPTDTKNLGAPQFDPCIIQVGYDMSTAFYSWVDSAWHGTFEARDLWIVQVGGGTRTRIEVQETVIGNVTLPRADSASSASTYLTVELLPTSLTPPAKCCDTLATPRDVSASPLTASSYRVTMTGFSDAFRTTKLDTYVVRNARSGCQTACPANRAIFPDVKAYIGSPYAKPLYTYFQDFVIAGNDTDAKERVVTVQWLNPDSSATLLSARFDGTGINYIDPYALKPSGNSLPKVRYNLYVEQPNIKKGAF